MKKTDIDRIDPEFLRWVRIRCREDDGCWVWRMSMKDGTQPQGKYLGETLIVRRALLGYGDKPIPRGHIGACKCETPGCVNPEHVVSMSRGRAFAGRVFTMSHKVALAKSARTRARLTEDQVADIRSGQEPIASLAEKYGLGKSYVSDVQRYKVWKDYANPYAGLMA